MKKLLILVFALFLVPNVSFAAGFTQSQISAIIGLLEAFNVPQATIDEVLVDLTPTTLTITPKLQGAPVQFQEPRTFSFTPPVPVLTPQAPLPVVQLPPMTPLYTDTFTIETQGTDKILRVVSNKLLDFPATTLPEGVTMSNLVIATEESAAGNTSNFGPDTIRQTAYYYQGTLTGATSPTEVTIHGADGSTKTKTIAFQ